LTWHITPDVMAYYTFSQGFRPGGFNQNGGSLHALGPDGVNQYAIPKSYSSDRLTNNEIGWKTEFFEHRLQWNGAIYQENWDNVQISFFDPGLVGNIFYDTNGQNFVIKGIETSLVARVINGLTLQGAASWNTSRQTNSPALIDNVPGSVNYGKAITQLQHRAPVACRSPIRSARSARRAPMRRRFSSACAPATSGTSPATRRSSNSAPRTAAISYTQAGSNPTIAQAGAISTSRLRFENPAYSTYAASFGVARTPGT
jgi:iron complex outermembrane receptor protein